MKHQQLHSSSNLQVQPLPWRRKCTHSLSKKNNFFDLIFSSQLPDASLLFYLTLIKIICKQKTAFMQKKLSLFPAVPFFFRKEEIFSCNHFHFQVGKRTLLSNFEVILEIWHMHCMRKQRSMRWHCWAREIILVICSSHEPVARMGAVRITSLNPKLKRSHFGLPPSSIQSLTGWVAISRLPWRMRTAPICHFLSTPLLYFALVKWS